MRRPPSQHVMKLRAPPCADLGSGGAMLQSATERACAESAANRTYRRHHGSDAIDPNRKSSPIDYTT